MTDDIATTADQIQRAVAGIKSLRPAYSELLDFYERLLIAQESSRFHLQIEPICVSSEPSELKLRHGIPLISLSDFIIDFKSATMLLTELCCMVEEFGGEMAASAKSLMNSIHAGSIDPKDMFTALLEENTVVFEQISQEYGINRNALAFLLYQSICPSVTRCVQDLSAYLNKQSSWENGYCPICGSIPSLSILGDFGGRQLVCSFCQHRWNIPRLFCPFCHNKNGHTLSYLYADNEPEYRVEVCNSCQRYIKTVDTRQLNRPFYPLLEQAATLHLDMIAEEKGLKTE